MEEDDQVICTSPSPVASMMDEVRRATCCLSYEVLGLIEEYLVSILIHSRGVVHELRDAFSGDLFSVLDCAFTAVEQGRLVERKYQSLPFGRGCVYSTHHVRMWEDGEFEADIERPSSLEDVMKLSWVREFHVGSLVTASFRMINPAYPCIYLLYGNRDKTVRTFIFREKEVFRVSDDQLWASNPRLAWICRGSVYLTTISFYKNKLTVNKLRVVETLLLEEDLAIDSQLLPSPISCTIAVLHTDTDKVRRIVSLFNVDTGKVEKDVFRGQSNEYILKHMQTLQCYGFHRHKCLARDSQRGYILDFDTRSIQTFPIPGNGVINLLWL
jgi:hypothetical protein